MEQLHFSFLVEKILDQLPSEFSFDSYLEHHTNTDKEFYVVPDVFDFFDLLDRKCLGKKNSIIFVNMFYVTGTIVMQAAKYVTRVQKKQLRVSLIRKKFEKTLVSILTEAQNPEYFSSKLNWSRESIALVYEYFRVNEVELPKELKQTPS